jgi:hypothetical protein
VANGRACKAWVKSKFSDPNVLNRSVSAKQPLVFVVVFVLYTLALAELQQWSRFYKIFALLMYGCINRSERGTDCSTSHTHTHTHTHTGLSSYTSCSIYPAGCFASLRRSIAVADTCEFVAEFHPSRTVMRYCKTAINQSPSQNINTGICETCRLLSLQSRKPILVFKGFGECRLLGRYTVWHLKNRRFRRP